MEIFDYLQGLRDVANVKPCHILGFVSQIKYLPPGGVNNRTRVWQGLPEGRALGN